jgi:hypothetical protein
MFNSKKLLGLVFILLLSGSAFAADVSNLDDVKFIAPGDRALYTNHDGTFENGFAWQYEGNAPPDVGAFAECFDITGDPNITSVVLWLTQVGNYTGQPSTIFVWEGSPPGAPLCTVENVVFTDIAVYPEFSMHEVPINCVYDGVVSVGFYALWPGDVSGFYIAADIDGTTGGCSWTNIAYDIGYPDGWQDPEVVWGALNSLGIGLNTSDGTAADEETWGTIKALY